MRESQLFILFIAFIALAESVTTFIDPVHGFSLHSLALISMVCLSALKYSENPVSSFFLSLSLAPLIRITSLSLPLAYFPRYSWYLLAGTALFLATLALIKVAGMSRHDIGMTFNKPLIQLAVGATGVPLGVIEYFILKPEPLASSFNLLEFMSLALALIFFTGFIEELVFRGVIQRTAIASLGRKYGVLGTSLIFAILHIGWLSILNFLFVFLVGLFFGLIVLKTNSIAGVSLSHGLTNVMLFMFMPFLLSQNL
ncbi:MAG: type II CAAX endopeptidase family protein [Nitrososphaerota archaeon]|nr:CPBP family intramembrane metalloprotease [Candidatus Nezhaarchaeota archaeon]MDW8049999.1 type II CAAX endopeptidase family protein [Nitrososphaerota archaeon]